MRELLGLLSNPKWKVRVDCAKRLPSFGSVEKLFSEKFKALKTFVSSYLANRIRRVACIPDGSLSSRRNHEATMDLQQIRKIMVIGLSGVQFSL